MAEVDERLAQHLHRPHCGGGAQSLGLVGHHHCGPVGQLHEVGVHERKEPVAQVSDEVLGERARIASGTHRGSHRRQGAAGVAVDEGLGDLVERFLLLDDAARGDHLVKRRQRVAGRSGALAHHGVERVG